MMKEHWYDVELDDTDIGQHAGRWEKNLHPNFIIYPQRQAQEYYPLVLEL